MTARCRRAMVAIVAVSMAVTPATAIEGRGDVAVRVDMPNGASIRGMGALRLRADACTVITPKHVVAPSLDLPGAHVSVQTADGRTQTADVAYLDSPGDLADLSILKLPIASTSLCAKNALEQPVSVESNLSSDSLVLDVIEEGGKTRRIPLYITAFDDSTVEIASRLQALPLLEGYSGAMVRTPEGQPIAMLTGVDATRGLGKAYRWDHVLSRLARWYLLADDVEPNCLKAPTLTVADGAKTSTLPAPDPEGWTAGNVTRRLAASPIIRVTGRLEVDIDRPIIACRLELAAGAHLVHVGPSALQVLSLEMDLGANATIDSLGADGASLQGAASHGAAGQGYDTGSRRGCDGTRHGAPGASGSDGRPGGDGGTAGNVVIAAAKVTGAFAIHSTGGKGGTGEAGGPGGSGGAGQGASSGSSSAFDCKCGGNPGGRGGDGGPGGRGGDGGRGGNAGQITTLVGVRASPPAPATAGGAGGAPGPGGPPGAPGPGGSASRGTGYCHNQRGSSGGDVGVSGARGSPGKDGDAAQVRARDFAGGKGVVDWPGFIFAVQGEFPMLFAGRR